MSMWVSIFVRVSTHSFFSYSICGFLRNLCFHPLFMGSFFCTIMSPVSILVAILWSVTLVSVFPSSIADSTGVVCVVQEGERE